MYIKFSRSSIPNVVFVRLRKDLPKQSPSLNAKSMTAMPCVWEPITNPDRTTNIDAHIDVHDETYYFIKFTNLQIYEYYKIKKIKIL